jgi:hypothetical protein
MKQLTRIFNDLDDIPEGFDISREETEAFNIEKYLKEFPLRYFLRYCKINEAEMRKWIIEVLRARLAQYATTLKQDRELLQEVKTIRSRKAMAIEVRIGEKEILTSLMEQLEEPRK